jgi:hypothetical protein
VAQGETVTTQVRNGFVRVGVTVVETIRPRNRGVHCPTGKKRHPSESGALDALMRVRKERLASGEARLPENRIYPCDRCGGWHLSSTALHPEDLATPRERGDGEPWEEYAGRLEKKIAAQRAEIVSLLALGHGGTNREMRKRVPALLTALAQTSERWHSERQNRENLLAILRAKHPLCWLVYRLTLGRKS